MTGDNPLEKNLKKMVIDRITVTTDDELVVNNIAKELKISDQIREAGILGEPMAVYVGISPQNPKAKEIAKMLSNGIIDLRKSGELKKILDRYGVKDWKK